MLLPLSFFVTDFYLLVLPITFVLLSFLLLQQPFIAQSGNLKPLKKPTKVKSWKFNGDVERVAVADVSNNAEMYVILKNHTEQETLTIGMVSGSSTSSTSKEKTAEELDITPMENTDLYYLQLPRGKKIAFALGEYPMKIADGYIYTQRSTKRRSVALLYRYRYTNEGMIVVDSAFASTDTGCILSSFCYESPGGKVMVTTEGRPGNGKVHGSSMKLWSSSLEELFSYTYHTANKYASADFINDDTVVVKECDYHSSMLYLTYYSLSAKKVLYEKNIELSGRYHSLQFCVLPKQHHFLIVANRDDKRESCYMNFTESGEMTSKNMLSDYISNIYYYPSASKVILQYESNSRNIGRYSFCNPENGKVEKTVYADSFFPTLKGWIAYNVSKIIPSVDGTALLTLYNQYSPTAYDTINNYLLTVSDEHKTVRLNLPHSTDPNWGIQSLKGRKFLIMKDDTITLYQY